MRTLFLEHPYLAVVAPATGVGLLLLPRETVNEPVFGALRPTSTMRAAARSWFHGGATGHDEVLLQLQSMGWTLPHDNRGKPAFYAAGHTDCCGRLLVSLCRCYDVDITVSADELALISTKMRVLANSGCRDLHDNSIVAP